MKSRIRSQDSLLTQSRHVTQAATTGTLAEDTPQKRNPSVIYFALAGAVVLVAGMVGVSARHQEESRKKIDLSNLEQRKKLEASVNRHIQLTNRKIEIERERIKMDATFLVPKVGHLVTAPRKEPLMSGLDLRGDSSEYNAARDTDRRGETTQTMHASEVVHSEMAEREMQEHAEFKIREKYAQEYIESARRNGFDVKLDADFRIISVKELPPSAREAKGEAYR